MKPYPATQINQKTDIMRPQTNEPCNNCKHWSNRTGCKIDRYNSTSMVMFGYCGFCKQKTSRQKSNQ